MFTSEQVESQLLTSGQKRIAIGILLVYLTLALALAFTARPQSDEAVYANPGYNLAFKGQMGLTVYELRGYLPLSAAQHMYFQPPLYFALTAGLFRIVGFGLVQVRLLSVIFGLVCLLSWYCIVRSLTKSATPALLAGALISVDYFFLIGASHGRMDMMCVGLGSAGLAVYVHWRKRSLFRAVFCGNTLEALAILTHPTGLVWAFGLWVGILLFDRRSLLSGKIWSSIVLPYFLAGLAWGSYIIQDPTAFFEQMKGALAVNEGSFNYSHLSHSRWIRYLQQEVLTRYAAPFGLLPGVALVSRAKVLILAAYLAGICGIPFVKRLRTQVSVLWFSVISWSAFFILAEISPSKFSYYLPHTTVMMAACLGVFLSEMNQSRRLAPIWAVIAVLGAIQMGGAFSVIRKQELQRTYLPVIDTIQRNSQLGSITMSEAELWFGLWRDRTVLYDALLGFRSGIRPDVFVMNSVFRNLHERDKQDNPAAYSYVENLIKESRLVYKDSYSEVYVPSPISEGHN